MFQQVAKGVARNTSIIFFQQIITTASSILLVLFLPRHLGPVVYGRLFLATSIVGIFHVVVTYGASYLITKEVSREKEHAAQLFVDSLALRIVLAIASIVGVLIIGWIAGYNEETNLILVLTSIGLLSQASTSTLFACYQGHELLQYTSYAAVAERVFISAVAITAILLGANVVVLVIILVIGGFLNTAILWMFLNRMFQSIPRVNWRNAKQQIKRGAPYFLLVVFGTIYYRIDTVMLSKMVPEEIVGNYGVAYRFFESMNFPYLLTVAVYPVLARLWKEEADMHRRMTQKSLEYVFMLGVLVSGGTILFAREIVSLFYGIDEYSKSVILLQCLGAGMLFVHIDMILGATLLASDKQKPLMYLSLATIPVNVILNYFMIPYTQDHFSNGAIGAAVATGITEIVVMVAFFTMLPKGVLDGFRYEVPAKCLIAGIVMAAVVLGGSRLHIHWVALGFTGVGVYAAMILLLRTLEHAEQQFLKELILVTIPKKIRTVVRY